MELLNVGQRLTLSFVKQDKIVEMSATIDEIYNDRMAVLLPTYFMRYINYLSEGSKLTVKVFSKAGTINFNSIVISSPLEEEFIIELDKNAMKLEPAEEIPPVNAIETLVIKNDDGSDVICDTSEISMTSIKFNTSEELNLNSEYDCKLALTKELGTISFKLMIKEHSMVYDTEYTASFATMSEDVRQKLLYYMYMYSQISTDGNNQ